MKKRVARLGRTIAGSRPSVAKVWRGAALAACCMRVLFFRALDGGEFSGDADENAARSRLGPRGRPAPGAAQVSGVISTLRAAGRVISVSYQRCMFGRG